MKRKLIGIAVDLFAAALLVLTVWIFNYVLPQKGTSAKTSEGVATKITQFAEGTMPGTKGDVIQPEESTSGMQGVTGLSGTKGAQTAGTSDSPEDWHKKFADKFTDTVIATDTSYTSPDLSIKLTYENYDTGKLDTANAGSHEKYGTKVSYVLADIYVGDISCIRTAFAQDTYGVGYTEKLTGMSGRMQAVLGINGDSYSNNRHKNNGTIIRNGVVYRNKPSDAETCVLNRDGTMDIYAPGMLDSQELTDRGAYQSWIFGPSLLDENGKAKTTFLTWDYIRESHPRTAIGYYEPGHYCMLVVDGRQKDTRGMFLEEMANVFENLGCKAAYNLDGGHCSFMTFQGSVANHPYRPKHEVPDGIFITEAGL